MKFIKIILLMLILFSSQLYATEKTFDISWTIPTTRINGSILNFSEISHYNILYIIDNADDEKSVEVSPASTIGRRVSIDLIPRDTPYTIEFYMTVTDTNNQNSVHSASVIRNVLVKPVVWPTSVDNFNAEEITP